MDHQKELEALTKFSLSNAEELARLEARQDRVEKGLATLYDLIRVGFKEAGFDFAKASAVVSSRTPKLDVPTPIATQPDLEHKFQPNTSGLIPTPAHGGGDGIPAGTIFKRS
jgi:hypothetical protein